MAFKLKCWLSDNHQNHGVDPQRIIQIKVVDPQRIIQIKKLVFRESSQSVSCPSYNHQSQGLGSRRIIQKRGRPKTNNQNCANNSKSVVPDSQIVGHRVDTQNRIHRLWASGLDTLNWIDRLLVSLVGTLHQIHRLWAIEQIH